jgi:hypothetical protein
MIAVVFGGFVITRRWPSRILSADRPTGTAPWGLCPARGRGGAEAAKEWQLRTVAAILANPRYTGRQVWNRQRTDHATHDADPGRVRYSGGTPPSSG